MPLIAPVMSVYSVQLANLLVEPLVCGTDTVIGPVLHARYINSQTSGWYRRN